MIGAEELLFELGGLTYGTSLAYGAGNILTARICANDEEVCMRGLAANSTLIYS
jgi:hypothetical protein